MIHAEVMCTLPTLGKSSNPGLRHFLPVPLLWQNCRSEPSSLHHSETLHPTVAGTFHDHSWTDQLRDKADIVVYQTNDPNQPNYFTGFAHEAQAYLRFLVDYYDCMPEVSVQTMSQNSGWSAGHVRKKLSLTPL